MKTKGKVLFQVVIMMFCIAGLLSLSQVANAAKFVVNSTDDAVDANTADGICETAPGNGVCTLRAAIQQANALAGPDKIVLKAKKYILTLTGSGEDAAATGDLDITDSATIVGAGSAYSIVDGNHSDRVFHVMGSSTITVKFIALTVQNGYVNLELGGGGIFNQNATATVAIDLCSVKNNMAFGPYGGGILNLGTLNVITSVIAQNSVYNVDSGYSLGGGISNNGPSGILTIFGSNIYENISSAAIVAAAGQDPEAGGGGVSSYLANTLTITNTKIMNNNTVSYRTGGYGSTGAGLFIFGDTNPATIKSTKILKNKSTGNLNLGGGVLVANSSATFSGCVISGNAASGITAYGGGFCLVGISPMAVTIDKFSKVTNNYAGINGGGIYINGTLTLNISANSVVADNTVDDIYPPLP
jgi:CSLREA domain-containing protein